MAPRLAYEISAYKLTTTIILLQFCRLPKFVPPHVNNIQQPPPFPLSSSVTRRFSPLTRSVYVNLTHTLLLHIKVTIILLMWPFADHICKSAFGNIVLIGDWMLQQKVSLWHRFFVPNNTHFRIKSFVRYIYYFSHYKHININIHPPFYKS